jgi:hypothetical protein
MRQRYDGQPYPHRPLDEIDQDLETLEREREQVIANTTIPLDPELEALLNMTYEAGQMSALYTEERKKNEQLNKVVIVKDEKIGELRERTKTFDAYRNRALEAEATIVRSQRARKAIKKKRNK